MVAAALRSAVPQKTPGRLGYRIQLKSPLSLSRSACNEDGNTGACRLAHCFLSPFICLSKLFSSDFASLFLYFIAAGTLDLSSVVLYFISLQYLVNSWFRLFIFDVKTCASGVKYHYSVTLENLSNNGERG